MPQQDAARNAGIQAFHPVGHGDAHRAGAGGDGRIGQALTLAADDDADAAGIAGLRRAQRLGLVQRSRKAGDALFPQPGDGIGHGTGFDHRDAHGGSHGSPQGLGSPHAGTAVAQDHAVKAKGRCRAQQGAHVAGVLHPFQRQIPPAGLHLVQAVHRGAEHAEYPLMGAHIGQLVGHVILHKVVLAGQVCQLRALCHGALGIKQGLQLCAAGKLRAQLAALGQKAALTAAECRAGRKAAGIFDLCVFPAGDLFVHCIPPAESGHSSAKKQKGQRLPQKAPAAGHCPETLFSSARTPDTKRTPARIRGRHDSGS